jgi:hypothetical protein
VTTTNYFDLSIKEILALAEGDDLDGMQLAGRLGRRIFLDIRKRVATLSDAETRELADLALVTDRGLALGGGR